jgi:hypothetical protein
MQHWCGDDGDDEYVGELFDEKGGCDYGPYYPSVRVEEFEKIAREFAVAQTSAVYCNFLQNLSIRT